jgi:hypothetical protein
VVVGLVSSGVIVGGVVAIAVADRHPARSDLAENGSTAMAPQLAADAAHAAGPERSDDDRWRRVLDQLDARREHAWRTGRPTLLGGVFTEGSSALRLDQRALAAYTARGLSIHGVTLEFASITLQARGPHWVRLVVVDRLGAVEVRSGLGETVPLPDDKPTSHLIRLRHRPGEHTVGWPPRTPWLIARIALA